MVERTTILLNVKRYVVVHEGPEIIRISYVNAVLGECPLNMSGAVAQKVIAAFRAK